MSQRAAYLINQIAQIHDGRIVRTVRRIAKTSGAESFAPSVNELSTMPPKKKAPDGAETDNHLCAVPHAPMISQTMVKTYVRASLFPAQPASGL